MSEKRYLSTPSNITRSKKKKIFQTSKYHLVEQSPTLDKLTPRGKGVPQSQGPYQPVKKVNEEPVYHAQPLKVVPLKKKRGRHTKERKLLLNVPIARVRNKVMWVHRWIYRNI